MKLFTEYKKEMNEGEKERESLMVSVLKRMCAADVFYLGDGKDDTSAPQGNQQWVIGHNDPEFKIIRGAIKKRYERAKKASGLKEAEEPVLLFTDYRASKQKGIDYLTEDENALVDEYVEIFENEHAGELDEGFFGRLIGAGTGLIFGATIGKIIAKVLGVERGIVFDLLTSKVVTTALGYAIGKYVSEKKPK